MSGEEINIILMELGKIKGHIESIDNKIDFVTSEQCTQRKILTGNGSPERSVVFRLASLEDIILKIKKELESIKTVMLSGSFGGITLKSIISFLSTKRGMIFLAASLIFISGGTYALSKAMIYLIKNNLIDFISKSVN